MSKKKSRGKKSAGSKFAWDKFFIIAVIVIIIASLISVNIFKKSGNKESRGGQDGIIEIRDRLFIAQINDVYRNRNDYLGKTIKLEGIFKEWQYDEEEKTYNYVLRYGPGCCGDDGNVGFEVMLAENLEYPEHDSWVEATGELKTYMENSQSILYLDLFSLVVMNTRGMEYVRQ